MVSDTLINTSKGNGLLPDSAKPLAEPTRTTGMPAFWGYLPPPYDYPYYLPVHIGPQAHIIDQFISDPKSKQDKVKVKNLKNLLKLQIFKLWKLL